MARKRILKIWKERHEFQLPRKEDLSFPDWYRIEVLWDHWVVWGERIFWVITKNSDRPDYTATMYIAETTEITDDLQ